MSAVIAVLARGGPVVIPLAACSILALAVNREPVAVADLEPRLRPMLQSNPALAIVINADGDASHRHVVAVLDALRLAGVSRMAIAVTPTSEAR